MTQNPCIFKQSKQCWIFNKTHEWH